GHATADNAEADHSNNFSSRMGHVAVTRSESGIRARSKCGKNAARQRRSSRISKDPLEPIAYEFRSTQKIRSQALQNRAAFFILTLRRIQTGNTRQPIQRPGDFGRSACRSCRRPYATRRNQNQSYREWEFRSYSTECDRRSFRGRSS